MASYGRPSLPFASPKTLKTPKTPKTLKTLQKRLGTPNPAGKSYPQATSMRNAQPRRQKLPQGQIHRFFWAVQPAVRQAFAANRHPKATSMASYGRPSLPFASPETLKTPRPHQWLLMGVQACRLPAPKPLKPLKLCISVSERPNRAGKSYPQATYAFSFTTPSLTENLFPHTVRWSICPVFKSLATFPLGSGANVNIRFFCTTPSLTENLFPHTVRWSICPVFTSLATFPLHAGQMYTYAFSFTTPSLTENLFPHTVRWSICPVFTSLATFPLQAGQT